MGTHNERQYHYSCEHCGWEGNFPKTKRLEDICPRCNEPVEAVKVNPTPAAPAESEKPLLNEAEYYFDKYKQTFKGVSAGEYLDKEDFMLIIGKLFLATSRKTTTNQND